MKITEIKIDRTTLPESGRKVEFKLLDTEEWTNGTFEAPDDIFVKNSRKWWSSWEVIEWRYADEEQSSENSAQTQNS